MKKEEKKQTLSEEFQDDMKKVKANYIIPFLDWMNNLETRFVSKMVQDLCEEIINNPTEWKTDRFNLKKYNKTNKYIEDVTIWIANGQSFLRLTFYNMNKKSGRIQQLSLNYMERRYIWKTYKKWKKLDV